MTVPSTMGKLKLAGRIARSNFGRLQKPYKLLLGLTYRCNERCLTCGIWKRKPSATTPELALKEIQTFFQKNNYFSWVNLTGGEIFLRKDLPDILSSVLTKCRSLCLLNFATNGQLPKQTERILNEMPKHPVSKTIVTVSVDGPKALNDKIRGVKGAFSKSMDTYRRLHELEREDIEPYFGVTLSQHNAGRLQDTYDALKNEIPSLRFTDLHLNVAHASPHYYRNNRINLTNSGIKRDIALHLSYHPRIPMSSVAYLEKRYLSLLTHYLDTKKTPVQCQALSASCYIEPSGTVYPCIVYDAPLGNIRDTDYTLSTIWNGKKAANLQQDIKRGKCPNCWLACEAYQSIMGGMMP